MREILYLAILLITLSSAVGCVSQKSVSPHTQVSTTLPTPLTTLILPEPRLVGEVSLEETLITRRSIREYTDEPLTLEEVSQLLWAAQGITSEWGGRTAPSAGGLFPLEVYLIAGNTNDLSSGTYRYQAQSHELMMYREGDFRDDISRAALDQEWVREGAINIIISAVYARTEQKYGDRSSRYVPMEAGHAAQNLYLQATAMGLGMVTVGAFHDDQVREILGMPESETPLYVIPVGRKS
ncbi:SagB/ThcOx family dehydrogenase [Chloroflexota bacterium]